MKLISEKFKNVALEDFLILSRKQLGEYEWNTDNQYAVVSISTPNNKSPKLELEDHILGIIKLEFYDVEETVDVEKFAMPEDDAEALVGFCNTVIPLIDILIVQCDAGISRSAGIGAAISKYYFNEDQWIFNTKRPNMHCYTTTLKKFYEKEKK